MKLVQFIQTTGTNEAVYVNPAQVLAVRKMGSYTALFMAAQKKDGEPYHISVKESVTEAVEKIDVALA